MTGHEFSYGYWLRRRRKALDLTQAELAARAGCVVTTIKKIERGTRRPSRQLAERLADALALSSEEHTTLLAAELPSSAPAPTSLALPSLPLLTGAGDLLIGRMSELAELRVLLTRRETRLLTLTGPGGVGKTRLALQAAADLRGDFADGAASVDLAPVNDPELVPPAIARSLGYEAGRAPLAVLLRALTEQHALLVLDNFEQVVAAAPFVAQMLAAAPHLKILVTSRTPLRIRYEQEYPVAPLELPPESMPKLGHDLPPDLLPEQQARGLGTYAAVQLFVRRAAAVQPHFVLTDENGAAVAAICRRLDGLPLAIELAAAHLRLLTPAALLRRLDRRLALLTGGARDLPARQQTLRATLDWSFGLLNWREQRVFARLGVFVNGATLEALEVVCDLEERGDALAAATALHEQSLLTRSADRDGEPRLAMLETVREYALEQLRTSGEEAAIRTRHAAYYLGLAEAAVPQLRSAAQVDWLDWLEADHDNLRAAGDWFHQAGRIEEELRLAAALHWFWDRRGYLDEGRARIRRALDATPNAELKGEQKNDTLLRTRAWALIGAAALAFDQGDHGSVAVAAGESAQLFEQLGDQPGDQGGLALAELRLAFAASAVEPRRADDLLAAALMHAAAAGDRWFKGLALFVAAQASLFGRGDGAAARAYIMEALPVLEVSGDPYLLAHGSGTLGLVELTGGDFGSARSALERGLALARGLRDTRSIAILAATTADVARCRGDFMRAAELYSESMALYQEIGNHGEIPAILHNQGYVALGTHDYTAARELFAESLRRQQGAGNIAGVVEGINGLAALATDQGQLERAARLYGAAEAIAAAHPAPVWPAERYEIDRYRAIVDAGLPASLVGRLRSEGSVYSLENAVTYALADGGPAAAQKRPTRGDSLSAREREVAALIGQGASNRAIAEALVISERTVERHVANIFAKLNFGSRTQIAAFAVTAGITLDRG